MFLTPNQSPIQDPTIYEYFLQKVSEEHHYHFSSTPNLIYIFNIPKESYTPDQVELGFFILKEFVVLLDASCC